MDGSLKQMNNLLKQMDDKKSVRQSQSQSQSQSQYPLQSSSLEWSHFMPSDQKSIDFDFDFDLLGDYQCIQTLVQTEMRRISVVQKQGEDQLFILKERSDSDLQEALFIKRYLDKQTGIIKILGLNENKNGFFYKMIDFDLLDLVQEEENGFDEAKCFFYFKQMVGIIQNLHDNKKVAHLDIKLNNFLVKKGGKVKLIDFETSIFYGLVGGGIERSKLDPSIGTAGYLKIKDEAMKDEMIKYEDLDVYSLGICLFIMFFKMFPFNKKAVIAAKEKGELSQVGNNDNNINQKYKYGYKQQRIFSASALQNEQELQMKNQPCDLKKSSSFDMSCQVEEQKEVEGEGHYQQIQNTRPYDLFCHHPQNYWFLVFLKRKRECSQGMKKILFKMLRPKGIKLKKIWNQDWMVKMEEQTKKQKI